MTKSISAQGATARRALMLNTPTDIDHDGRRKIADALNACLADVFTLYIKTKNFHWHMSGPHFRDYHLMLDEQSDQIFAASDPLAERVRKLGERTLHSIGQIGKLSRLQDNDAPLVSAHDMLAELAADNGAMAASLREAHEMCEQFNDVASASLIENYIDETERRVWFLFEASRV
ncbi:MAG: DNA starvation/stationary phase protection protein [Rhodospirillales bacterium 20-60-12]|nr:MAG: DNA starvation/stationary phase protection protein [Rhodospirillales bacterium 20-60-12]HQT66778.1 DNA starvation/stationary phase protection protein [Acetobacteraceae bacterium]HQU01490.1 DNA starvation/stationary phase protection protein [Acetobacteraceae bacterium]